MKVFKTRILTLDLLKSVRCDTEEEVELIPMINFRPNGQVANVVAFLRCIQKIRGIYPETEVVFHMSKDSSYIQLFCFCEDSDQKPDLDPTQETLLQNFQKFFCEMQTTFGLSSTLDLKRKITLSDLKKTSKKILCWIHKHHDLITNSWHDHVDFLEYSLQVRNTLFRFATTKDIITVLPHPVKALPYPTTTQQQEAVDNDSQSSTKKMIFIQIICCIFFPYIFIPIKIWQHCHKNNIVLT